MCCSSAPRPLIVGGAHTESDNCSLPRLHTCATGWVPLDSRDYSPGITMPFAASTRQCELLIAWCQSTGMHGRSRRQLPQQLYVLSPTQLLCPAAAGLPIAGVRAYTTSSAACRCRYTCAIDLRDRSCRQSPCMPARGARSSPSVFAYAQHRAVYATLPLACSYWHPRPSVGTYDDRLPSCNLVAPPDATLFYAVRDYSAAPRAKLALCHALSWLHAWLLPDHSAACDLGRTSTRSLHLWRLPPSLLLHLQRSLPPSVQSSGAPGWLLTSASPPPRCSGVPSSAREKRPDCQIGTAAWQALATVVAVRTENLAQPAASGPRGAAPTPHHVRGPAASSYSFLTGKANRSCSPAHRGMVAARSSVVYVPLSAVSSRALPSHSLASGTRDYSRHLTWSMAPVVQSFVLPLVWPTACVLRGQWRQYVLSDAHAASPMPLAIGTLQFTFGAWLFFDESCLHDGQRPRLRGARRVPGPRALWRGVHACGRGGAAADRARLVRRLACGGEARPDERLPGGGARAMRVDAVRATIEPPQRCRIDA